MKKLLIILVCLFSFNSLTYASFPITESSSSDVSSAISFQMAGDGDDGPSLIEYIIGGILFFLIPAFGLYFLIRAWWRAWKDDVRWVKIVTYILLVTVVLSLLLSLIFYLEGGLYGGMGG